jgi:hypothetical protein
MPDEIEVLLDVASRLDGADIPYMLTGSMARNFYAVPRMTRDIDLVAAIVLKDVLRLTAAFPETEFYRSEDAIRGAILHQSSFNFIHLPTMMKIDVMIRKRAEYRLEEFTRRRRVEIRGRAIWLVSKEDLILSKLEWARESKSERQLEDVRLLLASEHDISYVRAWAEKLQLTPILTQVSP